MKYHDSLIDAILIASCRYRASRTTRAPRASRHDDTHTFISWLIAMLMMARDADESLSVSPIALEFDAGVTSSPRDAFLCCAEHQPPVCHFEFAPTESTLLAYQTLSR
jgi:hypothetical protein